MRYIFYYSEDDNDHNILTKSLPLDEHRISLVNIRELNLPRDSTDSFLMGEHLLTDVVLMKAINGSRIFVADSLEDIKEGRVKKDNFLEKIRKFFLLDTLDSIDSVLATLDVCEQKEISLSLPGKNTSLNIPEDLSFTDFKAFLYMIKFLGFYNVEIK